MTFAGLIPVSGSLPHQWALGFSTHGFSVFVFGLRGDTQPDKEV